MDEHERRVTHPCRRRWRPDYRALSPDRYRILRNGLVSFETDTAKGNGDVVTKSWSFRYLTAASTILV
jgi:hypothetical protein